MDTLLSAISAKRVLLHRGAISAHSYGVCAHLIAPTLRSDAAPSFCTNPKVQRLQIARVPKNFSLPENGRGAAVRAVNPAFTLTGTNDNS
jgi:hypothetical protein